MTEKQMNTFEYKSTSYITGDTVKIYISGKRKRVTHNTNSTERRDFV